jgi:ketosteroid isomerase-like protein
METKVVVDFADAISHADVDRICSLMTDDHLFVDSQDHRIEGKEMMKIAWIAYFGLFPDYKIEIEELFENGSSICILGYASGTYKSLTYKSNNNHWRVPAAWKAVIKDNLVKHWQVYTDNLIVVEIINRNK